MANVFTVNVYKINQRDPEPRDTPQRISFPSTGVLLRDCSGSPTRSLSSGYNVYGIVQLAATGDQFYCAETIAQLIVLAG